MLLLLGIGGISSSKEIMAGSSRIRPPLPDLADCATDDASESPGLCMETESLTSCWLPVSCLSCSYTHAHPGWSAIQHSFPAVQESSSQMPARWIGQRNIQSAAKCYPMSFPVMHEGGCVSKEAPYQRSSKCGPLPERYHAHVNVEMRGDRHLQPRRSGQST